MTLPFVFKPTAREEFAAAADWYDRRKHGLGDRFVETILTLIDRICERPASFPIVAKDVRQAIERKFPYSVLYRIRDNRVVILSVFHSSRDPKSWEDRI